MRRVVLVLVLLSGLAFSAAKPHVVSFGKPLAVKLFLGPSEDRTMDMTVRALCVDTKLKEFTTGEPHDITERLFVVRRAYRINDSLPDDPKKLPKWMWQRGGWLLVDRSTGRVSSVNLPDFDPFYSQAAWYRDYVAYCGLSDSALRVYAVVTQVGRKKPLLRKEIAAATNGDDPDAECSAPRWERQPARVTFLPKKAQSFTFTLPDRSIELVSPADEESENK